MSNLVFAIPVILVIAISAFMVKIATGYDPQNGDWWYASYDATGTKARKQGRLDGTIPCHKQAAETDHRFSKDVLDAVKQ